MQNWCLFRQTYDCFILFLGVSIRPGFAINPPVPLPEEPLGVSEVTEDRPKPGKAIENIL